MPDENHIRNCLESIRATIQLLSTKLEERDIIEVLLDRVVSSLPVKGALLLLLNPKSDEFLLSGSHGLSETYLAKIPLSIAASDVNQRLMAGETVVLKDLALIQEFRAAGAAQEGLKILIAVPMIIRGRVIGAIHTYNIDALSDQQPIALLDTLSDLGAMVLEKARLHSSLFGIAEALNSPADLKRMLELVLRVTVSEMWLKGASIRLLDEKTGMLNLVAAHGLSAAYSSKREEMPLTGNSIDKPVMKGEVIIIQDLQEETRFDHLDDTLKEGIRSILVVPLTLKSRILGVMRVYATRPRYFSPVGATFLRSVADLVSLAIERADLYAALEKRYNDLKIDLADWHRFLTLG